MFLPFENKSVKPTVLLSCFLNYVSKVLLYWHCLVFLKICLICHWYHAYQKCNFFSRVLEISLSPITFSMRNECISDKRTFCLKKFCACISLLIIPCISRHQCVRLISHPCPKDLFLKWWNLIILETTRLSFLLEGPCDTSATCISECYLCPSLSQHRVSPLELM